ncbi:MAG: hypothetical protein C0448_05435 [Sphingobacteriaceae bacterium]|nr:hypothetical protein [Sphingobacteriaceae bacterium]
MHKLKKIITQIHQDHFLEIEESLKGTNSVKFHFLFTEYKKNILSDEDIKNQLNCTDNSYYVLKSRLYDKIQKFILSNNNLSENQTSANSNSDLTHYLYEFPNETTVAMLQELENKYIAIDSPNDLMNVYSALKKAHFYSDKYYAYSQLYNNQVAYALAIEKAEETLYNFNRTLSSYYFSDSPDDIELMKLLIKEIKNIHSLYKSSRIEIILNIIIIQSTLFAKIDHKDEPAIEDLLSASENILIQYENDSKINYYKPVIKFLYFEYYFSLNQLKKASTYFIELETYSQKWLLQNNSCLAFKFLLSKIEYLLIQDQKGDIGNHVEDMYFDSKDLYTDVIYKFYKGISLFYDGKTKKCITTLNDLLNEISFKNFFYIESEVKLSLAFFYISQNEIELAENILKGLSRKLATIKIKEYKNIKEAIKLFNILMNDISKAASLKKYKDSLDQFEFYNLKEKKVLSYLMPELELLASGNRRK